LDKNQEEIRNLNWWNHQTIPISRGFVSILSKKTIQKFRNYFE
jgi:hypothetical protein